MNSLPNEILHSIFIQVPLRQKLECMLVCRYWYNSLRRRSLLYHVEIKSNDMFNNFSNMLQHFPSRGSQVEILHLVISSAFDKRQLCNIFPNLRIFRFTNSKRFCPSQNHCSLPFKPVNPNSKLESITDGAECELTRQLLMFHSCSRLRSLKLALSMIENPRKEIFGYLKNTPALKELGLSYGSIAIDDLEIIHKHATALETLSLEEMTLLPGILTSDITPATSVRKFAISIDEIVNYPDYSDWYKYMAKKYTNLTSFSCQDREMINVDSIQMIKIYQDGILPLYGNIGNHLDYFKAINIPTELNAFKTLDEFGLQILHFHLQHNGKRPIFEQLADSNQAKYAKSIELTRTVIASPIMLQNFTSLTKLKIDGNQSGFSWNVNLTDLFNAIPATLTSLSARLPYAAIKELPSRSNNVENLTLKCSKIYPKLAEAISNHFPKLDNLTLGGVVTENLNLNLPDNHFKDLRIIVCCVSVDSVGFSVTDASSPQPQYYIRDPNPGNSFDMTSVTAEEFQDRININLKYTTTKTRRLFTLLDRGWI